jgi:translocation and assembly module TamA
MIKTAFLKTLAVAGALLCFGCSTVRNEEGVAYKVKMRGADDGAVKQPAKKSAATWKLRKQLPATVGQLHYRMEQDLDIIQSIMESRGYYDGQVSTDLDTQRTPARATFMLDMGEQYRFRHFDLFFLGDADARFSRIKPRIRSKQGVVASAVFENQRRILEWLTHEGYPFPKLVKRVVNVDRELRVVDVALVTDPGELAYFSESLVEGLDELPDQYIFRQLPWKPGDRYDARKVKDFERKMLESGLFKSARVEPQEPAAYTNAIPVTVRVAERAKRTARLGLNYSDIGLGGKAYWEHRNFLGGGEQLESSLTWSPIEEAGSVTLTRAGFLGANQWLVLDVEAARETPDAYDADTLSTSGMILRDFSTRLQGGIGIGAKYSVIDQLFENNRYLYAIFPLQAIYNSSNDRLNPVSGVHLFGRTAFFEETLGSQSFLKTQFEGRHYHMLWDRYRLSSALRVALGSIDGAAVEAVSADERFYAGGGGSIRGYEYQSVGAQVAGEPVGGDKLFEFSTELRLQPGKQLGYVAFIDGGTVYNELFDSYNRTLRYGAGFGVRWFSTLGPLRADLAYPLNPSSDQVERLQFYISLGQAF